MRQINKWKLLTEDITDIFIREYFEIPDDEEADFSWVADEVGGVFEFADYFFSFSDVLDCYKHNVTKHQLFMWYTWCLDNHPINISLAKFVLSPAEKEEAEKKHLEELKQRMEWAEKEFKEALEQYGK